MNEFICINVSIPLRKGPSHKTEMGTQILFGEKFYIIEKAGDWRKIRINWYNYTGWVDKSQVDFIPASDKGDSDIISKRVVVRKSDGTYMTIEPGSEVYSLSEDRKSFFAGNEKYDSDEPIEVALSGESISATALKFLNAPYLWGGRTPAGIDCSGLTQIVYKLHKIRIPRDSYEQAERGVTIDFLSDALPGDLIFFDDDSGKICHVGIYYDEGKILHCSGRVRIDVIDHQGIYRDDLKKYSHRLRVIKRIIKQ
ncbi:MAG TPA: C40 family peptidase [Bacteroidales bacterium]|nr:C40 family peptidase [Bacteroidales bacterium]